MSRFTKSGIIRHYSGVEGGYVKDLLDLGGETNHGVTKAVAEKHKKVLVSKFSWSGRMIDLTTDMAFYIYEVDYWDRIRGDSLMNYSPALADKMFDIAINMGTSIAVGFLQKFLNVMNNRQKLYPDIVVDGIIGNVTMGALQDFNRIRGSNGISRLVHFLYSAQTLRYAHISSVREANERFTYGWVSRAYDSMIEYNKHNLI